jgi:iron(III) transport system substrate-binding protein
MKAASLFLAFAIATALSGCKGNDVAGTAVVVYVSEDQVFSQPILNDFEKESGIRVRAVFDTEEAKSTGVMNRLLAEKSNPQADVYWANEPIRAELLKRQSISTAYRASNAAGIPAQFKDPEGHWTGFSARARVLVVHTAAKGDKPKSVRDYADSRFSGRGVIANPLFGTTTAYTAALFTMWGDDEAKRFLDTLKQNGVKISTSNGESADLVASAEFDFSLVDSDDAFSRRKQNRPIEIVYPDQGPADIGCMIIPNALVMVRGGPHPENARKLIEYLLSKETERKLAFSDAAQIPLHSGVETPPELRRIGDLKTMQIDYGRVAAKMQEIQPYLKTWAGF